MGAIKQLLIEKMEYVEDEIVFKAILKDEFCDNTLYNVDSINFRLKTINIFDDCNYKCVKLDDVDTLWQFNGKEVKQLNFEIEE